MREKAANNDNIVYEYNNKNNIFTRNHVIKNHLIDVKWLVAYLGGVKHQGKYSTVIVMVWEYKP